MRKLVLASLTLASLECWEGRPRRPLCRSPITCGSATILRICTCRVMRSIVDPTTGLAVSTIQPGDIFQGIYEITLTQAQNGGGVQTASGFELDGVFSSVVASITGPTGSAYQFQLSPNLAFDTANGLKAGAMISMYDDPVGSFSTAINTHGYTMAQSLAAVTSSQLYMSFGALGSTYSYTSTLGTNQADPKWGDNSGYTGSVPNGNYYWAANGPVVPGVANFAASLALLDNNSGINSNLFTAQTQSYFGQGSPQPGFNTLLANMVNQFSLKGSTGNVNSGAQPNNPWQLSNTDPLVGDLVPEPSSVLVMGGLFGAWIVGLVAYRRKRMA